MTPEQKYRIWKQKASYKPLLRELNRMDGRQIEDAFFKDLEFGTAGMRGKMGAGTNRLNIYTVRRVTQGAADYLKDGNFKTKGQALTVCISYDSRINSHLFAQIAAAVFAENGINAVITRTLMPTPYLSFLVRRRKADMGVMVTASHNPSDYNGYKVYGSDGCQLTDEAASRLAGYIDKIDPFDIRVNAFTHYLKQSMISVTGAIKAYLDEVKCHSRRFANSGRPSNNRGRRLKIMFTPLNGAGYLLAREALEFMGAEVKTVPEQAYPDGRFTTCPSPNPEKDEAFAFAVKHAMRHGSDLIIAVDPDADRVGVMVKGAERYVRLSGNEIGVLLAEYLLRKNAEALKYADHPSEKSVPSSYANANCASTSPLIIRTVVSTPLADRIADAYGAEVTEVLTGFKYIGEYISGLEKDSRDNRFLLGFEESCGYLCGTHARDKDGVEASMLIAEMAAEYLAKGKTLLDAMDGIYAKYGYYLHKTLSYKFEGSEGSLKIFGLMDTLRNRTPSFMGAGVASKKDYMVPQNGLPLTNMMEFTLDCGRLIVRPSGTEPLIKAYITATGAKAEAESYLKEIENWCNLFFV